MKSRNSERKQFKVPKMKVYIFFRGGMFYPVEYLTDNDARDGAVLNIGTTKVETVEGKVIWTSEQ
jgi:hypothetical protein